MDGDKFDCQRCRFGYHCDDTGEWPLSRGAAPNVILEIPDVVESRTCLLPMVGEAERAWLRGYTHYQAGYLPSAGGINDQPAAFVEAMELIATHYHRIERERIEKEHGRNPRRHQR